MSEKWTDVNYRVGWLNVIAKGRADGLSVVRVVCDCGKVAILSKVKLESVINNRSRTFSCETCYQKNTHLPSDKWAWVLPDSKNYMVSMDGVIVSTPTGKTMTLYKDDSGCLSTTCGGVSLKVHLLVAKAFIPNPLELSSVKFIDGDRTNPASSNLEWVDSSRLNLVGEKFGRLVVLSWVDGVKSGIRGAWNCICDCGNATIVASDLLKNGNTRSCGCFKDEITKARFTKHGGVGDTEYCIWNNIKQRTTNPKSTHWDYYGGRGIVMCEEWQNDYSKFLEDMGKRPTETHTIDRIDVNGGYNKGNCRWATRSEQSFNQRMNRNNKSGRAGVYSVGAKWVVKINSNWVGSYTTFEEACNSRTEQEILLYGYSKE